MDIAEWAREQIADDEAAIRSQELSISFRRGSIRSFQLLIRNMHDDPNPAPEGICDE